MQAEIITIGDEILIGQIVDTNSAWMAAELNKTGIGVYQITSISDNPDHLVSALNEARSRADVVLITGGLGPTKDDRTKKVLADYFDAKLVLHEPTLDQVTDFFKRRSLDVNQLNHDQALVPKGCKVLENPVGTAPGMWFENNDKIFVSMPGVPFEMKEMMTSHVLPALKILNGDTAIVHRTVLTVGVPESILAETLEQWEQALPEHIHLAYLPNPGQIRLRFSAFGSNEQELKNEIEAEIEKLKKIIPDSIFGYGDENLAGVVGQLLLKKGATMASAESCTGGQIAHYVTANAGSSAWYKGSVVAYSNQVKENVLGVNHQTLIVNGAVSKDVVVEMAEGVKRLLNVDYAVATSGIAGPDGGTKEKPVGTVWIAVVTPDQTIAKKYNFSHNRERNIIRSSQMALNELRLLLIEKNKACFSTFSV